MTHYNLVHYFSSEGASDENTGCKKLQRIRNGRLRQFWLGSCERLISKKEGILEVPRDRNFATLMVSVISRMWS